MPRCSRHDWNLQGLLEKAPYPLEGKRFLWGPPPWEEHVCASGALDTTGTWKSSQAGARSKPHFITRVARESAVSLGRKTLLMDPPLSGKSMSVPRVLSTRQVPGSVHRQVPEASHTLLQGLLEKEPYPLETNSTFFKKHICQKQHTSNLK